MENQSSIDKESLRLVYETCCKMHRYFLTWRHQLLAGYLATFAGLSIAIGWTYSNNAKQYTWVIFLMGAFMSIIFLLLEYRNKELYQACSRVASTIEDNLGFNSKENTNNTKDLLIKSNGLYFTLRNDINPFKITHTCIIYALYTVSIILFIIASIYSYCAFRCC